MTQDKPTQRATHSRWFRLRKQILPLLFAFLMVASLPAMTLAGGLDSGTASAWSGDIQSSLSTVSNSQLSVQTATEDNTSYYDDFEDGNYDGWDDPSDVTSVSNDSFYGNNSINAQDNGDGARWTSGPSFHTQDNFEFSGTYKVERTTSDQVQVRFGIIERDTTTDDPVVTQVMHRFSA